MGKAMADKLIARGLRLGGGKADKLLLTPRLLLRPLRMKDAEDFHAYARNPEVARYVLWDPHTSLSQTRGILRSLMAQSRLEGLHTRAITLRDTGRMVGTIGLVNRDFQNHTAEVGFSIARDCWGQGLTAEALSAYLAYLFSALRLHRVEAQHDAQNPASGRVMEKAGMAREGLLAERLYYKGRYASLVVYAALRESWVKEHPGLGSRETAEK